MQAKTIVYHIGRRPCHRTAPYGTGEWVGQNKVVDAAIAFRCCGTLMSGTAGLFADGDIVRSGHYAEKDSLSLEI